MADSGDGEGMPCTQMFRFGAQLSPSDLRHRAGNAAHPRSVSAAAAGPRSGDRVRGP